jgi:hypothetical protein
VASHPKFDPKTFEYDVALLRFYEPVSFQPNVVPICVPEDDNQLVGETAWVTGWGRLYEGNGILGPNQHTLYFLYFVLYLFVLINSKSGNRV